MACSPSVARATDVDQLANRTISLILNGQSAETGNQQISAKQKKKSDNLIGINWGVFLTPICSITFILCHVCRGQLFTMTDKDSTLNRTRSPGNDGSSLPFEFQSQPNELSGELQKYAHALGPTPKRCLETLTDLGLTDLEIARYFNMPSTVVIDLRLAWNIGGES